MKKISEKNTAVWLKSNRTDVLIFLITMLVISIPMLRPELFTGHDIRYHMLRIQSLYHGIANGEFPVRVNSLFFGGFGYGSSLFYPDIFLYIPVLFQFMGFSLHTSIKLFIIITNIVCYIVTYYSAKGITKNRYAAVIAAVVFTLSQYHLQNIYTRFALGEVQSYIFIPLIIYGLYNLIYEEFEKPQILVIGFVGLMFCHTISVFIAVIVAIILVLFNMRRVVFNAKKMLHLTISAIVALLLTCGQWMVMLEQIASAKFRFQYPNPSMMAEMAVIPQNMFANSYYLENSICSFGITIVLLCFMRIFIQKSPENEIDRKKINCFMYSGFFLLFAASAMFPWRIMPSFFNNIQFPWRFYVMASLFLAVAIGIMANLLAENEKEKNIALMLIIIFSVSFASDFLHTVAMDSNTYTRDAYTLKDNTFTIGGAEWLPINVDYEAFKSASTNAKTDNGNELQVTRDKAKTTVEYTQNSRYIDFPILYYKGYSAVFTDNTGEHVNLKLSNQGDNKTVRVDCSPLSSSGRITVKYTGTFIQHFSFYANIIFALAALAYIYRNKNKKDTDLKPKPLKSKKKK